ncbi:TlpA family protein disulfide reductase [Chitinophaga rhizosphaerae]|uniref:TlpA family protein disulfide reductase n=1 Tax=Chitinophaga rhizosphaerae TaxID=1864947 RepID=UPI000F804D5D|nr:TlpA disulfide reductase family protein [Chitinophaga rhizosphaerae]
MKTSLYTAAFLLSVSSGFAQQLRISTPLHTDGSKVTVYREWPTRQLIDTPLVNDGRISIRLPDSGRAVYSVQLRKPWASATVFSSRQPIDIVIGKDTQVAVRGDAVLQKLVSFEKSLKPLEAEWNRAGTEYGNTQDMEKKLVLSEKINRMADEVQQKRLNFSLQNAGNLAGAWSAWQYAFAWNGASLTRLIPSFRQQPWAAATLAKLQDKQAEAALVNMTGKPAPAFALRSLDGNVVRLDSLLAGNRYVLLDVWASWCTPCRAGNRKLAPHYAALKKKGIEIVSVSVDEKDDLWRKAVAADKIPWPQLVAPEGMKSGIVADYKVQSLPATFLIDKSGKIIRQHVELPELEKID